MRFAARSIWLLGVLAALLAIGCRARTANPSAMNVPAMAPRPLFDADLRAGVARVDITPTPGLSLFGHGPEGRVSAGFRLRLACKVIVLSRADEAIVLVPCDLAAPSFHLQREIAMRARDLGVPVGADAIALMATHTHAGPAHYFGERRYSGSFSSYAPGFDPAVRTFLAERIAAGIKSAWIARRPACVGWASDAVYGLTTNRSHIPFLANHDLSPAMMRPEFATHGTYATADGGAPAVIDPTRSVASRAIDPTLSVLRIDGVDASGACNGEPLGVFAVFGMHPTAIPNTNVLYHGDVFGFATRAAEACIERTKSGGRQDASCVADGEWTPKDDATVVGLANGIEGDVSPDVDYQATREARRLGTALALAIVATRARAVPNRDARLRHAYRELHWPNARVLPDSPARLCPDPEIGTAAAGGARDGITRYRILPAMNPGVRLDEAHGCHGNKLVLVPPEGKPTDEGKQFLSFAPIAEIEIADGIVTTLPVEITTVAGLRVRRAVGRSLSSTHRHFPIVGLTNAYLQYAVTLEEYPFQQYEGASTLYGPNTARFLEHQTGCLAEWLAVSPNERAANDVRCRADQPRSVNDVLPIPEDEPEPVVHRLLSEDETESTASKPVVSEPCVTRVGLPSDISCVHGKTPRRALDGSRGWSIEWKGISPAAMPNREQLAIQIVSVDGPGIGGAVIDDDTGPNIELVWTGQGWCAGWFPELGEPGRDPRCGKKARFFVRGRVRVFSEPFAIDCVDDHHVSSSPVRIQEQKK